MKSRFLLLALLFATPVFAQAPVSKSQMEANKQLVIDFFKVGPAKPDVMAGFLADDYIQHNPRFLKFDEDHHVSGKAGFLAAIQSGILRPPAPANPSAAPPPRLAPRTQELIMAEGDLVTVIWKQARPDPDDASKTYDTFAFDTFRIRNGKFAEHWDGALR
jgi:predicted SnoaL-like aldol condensation-catalyzing enzyme